MDLIILNKKKNLSSVKLQDLNINNNNLLRTTPANGVEANPKISGLVDTYVDYPFYLYNLNKRIKIKPQLKLLKALIFSKNLYFNRINKIYNFFCKL